MKPIEAILVEGGSDFCVVSAAPEKIRTGGRAAFIMVGSFEFVFWFNGKEGGYGRAELWSSVFWSG